MSNNVSSPTSPAIVGNHARKGSVANLASPISPATEVNHARKGSVANLATPTSGPATVANHLRKGSVVISVSDLRRQSVVPTAIPGETQRTEPLKNNGKGRENLLRVLSKQVNVNREKKELQNKIEKEIIKESILKKEKQDKMVKVFFKEESPYTDKEALAKVKRDRKQAIANREKPTNRGNLDFFLEKNNFKEPACLTAPKKKTNSKYDEIDTRLKTDLGRASSSGSGYLSSSLITGTSSTSSAPATRVNVKPRLPPNKATPKKVTKPETNLLPYPQDVTKNENRLHFVDVWKKGEPKDVFPHVNRFVIFE